MPITVAIRYARARAARGPPKSAKTRSEKQANAPKRAVNGSSETYSISAYSADMTMATRDALRTAPFTGVSLAAAGSRRE